MQLFDVEIKSHWVKEQLAKPHSSKYKLILLSSFLNDLIKSKNAGKFISYYNEFTPLLVKLISHLPGENESAFLSPVELDNLSNVINALENFINIKKEAGQSLAVLNNERARILNILNGTYDRIVNATKNIIHIVLIENGSEIGQIQKLELKSSKLSKGAGKDKIEFSNLDDNNGINPISYLENIIFLVKRYLGKSILKINTYNFYFSIEKSNCNITGSSYGLALSALVQNSILINELYKDYYRFWDDTVITGAIDENGNVLKLDKESLRIKIKTVFFSNFDKIVIPEDNILEAKEILNELHKKYPRRKISLLPVSQNNILFKNLDIVEPCKLKLKEKVIANYDLYHRTINWILSILIMFVSLYFVFDYMVPLMDRNPIYTNLVNQKYVAFNKYNKPVWESNLLSDEDIYNSKHDNQSIQKRIILTDLDDDGYNEILLLLSSEKNRLMNRTIYCYNHDGSLRWKTQILSKDSYYGNDYCNDDIFIRKILVIQNENKKEIIINYRVCTLFPDYTAKINTKGEIVSEFYNPGTTNSLLFYDIDEDGKKELISSGINNDYEKSGALIVFDPEFITGSGPGYRLPKNSSPGLMKYYLLFPKTDVGKFTNHGSSEIQFVEISNNQIIVYLEEVDTFKNFKNETGIQKYITIYTLDRYLSVLHVETSSEFDTRYQQLVNEGKLTPVRDWKLYKDGLKSHVQYWDGDKFINQPVKNKYYLEALKHKPAKTSEN